jgi:TDG/mug DNA glycosylase family protein
VILPDVLKPGLVLVFCGTAVSRVSQARGYPYANPGNAFWPTVKKLGVFPTEFDPAQFPRMVEHGIGYTDLSKTEVGIDSDLSADAFDVAAFTRKMKRHKPKLIAFTSKHAGATFFGDRKIGFGLQPLKIGDSEVHVLPSPSGLARSHWNVAPWQALATHYKALRM